MCVQCGGAVNTISSLQPERGEHTVDLWCSSQYIMLCRKLATQVAELADSVSLLWRLFRGSLLKFNCSFG